MPDGQTVTGTASPLIFSGLTNGTSYTFTAVAINAAGTSVTSVASTAVIPFTVPSQITSGINTTGGNAQVSVAFPTPFNGGTAITGFTVTASPGGASATGIVSPITVTGLTNGTSYTFTVISTNAAGNSLTSSPTGAIIPNVVPNSPTDLTATAGIEQASIAFTTPLSNSGTATSYTVTASPGGASASGTASPLIVYGLWNGTSYTFTAIATNSAGNSIISLASTAAIPFTNPDAPTGLNATAGNSQVSVAFSTPFNGYSAITGYTVTASPGGQSVTGAISPLVVTGLTNGTSYTFTAVAINAAGTSVTSVASTAVIPFTVPSQITSGINTTGGNAQVSVAFPTPFNGGSVITGYTVTASPGGASATGIVSPITVTGLTSSSYTFTVVSTNAAGNSIVSWPTGAVSVCACTVPSSPSGIIATKGNSQVSIAFTAPVSDGGTAITGYTVTASPGGTSATGTESPLLVTGLTLGTSYTFTVVATNAIGNSLSSTASTVTTRLESGSAICNGSVFTDIIELTSATGRVWMDRNLGASRAGQTSTDFQAYGCLYQWGRGNDGHASISWTASTAGSPVNGTTGTLATTDTPVNALFIDNGTDWRSNNNNTRWQRGTQVNNPCPSGFYVPTDLEITAEYTQYAITNAATAYANGPGTGFRFVLPGYRSGASLASKGGSIHIWSSTVSGTNSLNRINTANGSYSNADFRNQGFSVRCIKN